MKTSVIPIEAEVAPEALDRGVEEAGRAWLVDPVAHALDESRGLVLLREAEAEPGDRLRHVEGLPVVVVVAAVEQLLVDAALRLLDQALPYGVALLRRPEAQEPQSGVRKAVFGERLREHLGRHAARSQVYEVKALERRLARVAVVLPEREYDMPRLIRPGLLAWDGKNGAVGLYRVEIVAQD